MNLNDLKEKISIKEKQAKSEEIEKINLIKSLLKNENCFFEIDMKLAIDILYFLGVEKEKLLETYYQLIKPNNLKKEDEVVEIIDLKQL